MASKLEELVLDEFTIDGPPVPKARARTVVTNGKVRTFTPAKTVNYERLIGLSYRGQRRYEGPVQVIVQVRESMTQHAGDADNYLKSALDGLNGIAWVDDKQVQWATVTVERKSPRPGLKITVAEIAAALKERTAVNGLV